MRTRGLYYKTLYGSNCCRIVISQSVCHFLSLPPWPNICWQDQEPAIGAESIMGLYSGMIEPCPQILDQGGSDRKQQTLQLITVRQQLLPYKVLQYRPQKKNARSEKKFFKTKRRDLQRQGSCSIKPFTTVIVTVS